MHREIGRLMIQGFRETEVAEILGLTNRTVSYTMKSIVFQDYLTKLREKRDESAVDVGVRIKNCAPRALTYLEELVSGNINSENITPNLRVKVCQDILDRAGYGAVTKSMNLELVGKLSYEDLEEAKRRIKEEGTRSGSVVSAEMQDESLPTTSESCDSRDFPCQQLEVAVA
jgi:DNA-binding MarR family transcriptional regulator